MKTGYYIRGRRAREGALETIDNVTKFALADEDYEDFEEWVEYTPEEYAAGRITELKQLLAKTDYVAAKIAEGAATREEYADILKQREEWRRQINEITDDEKR